MDYDSYNRPQRGTNDSTYQGPSLLRTPSTEQQHSTKMPESHSGGGSYMPPSVQDEYREDDRPARMPSPPMSEASVPPTMEQPMDISNISPELIAHLTKHITAKGTFMFESHSLPLVNLLTPYPVVEQIKNESSVDTAATEAAKKETMRTTASNADQPKSEPIARCSSPDKMSSTSTPSPPARNVYTPPSPRTGATHGKTNTGSLPFNPLHSPPNSPTKDKYGVRFSNPRDPVDKDGAQTARPTAYRSASSSQFTTIDQKWGRLFDHECKPTARLGQFLRGLANHIVSNFIKICQYLKSAQAFVLSIGL